jgi:23S rRNA (uridine2552-2'-O)-methyltransferase
MVSLRAMFLALGDSQLDSRHGDYYGFGRPGKNRSMKIKTKSRKVNKAWLNDHVNDPYVKLAQKEGYRARAAFKLKEIDEALGLVKAGHLVVDLGSAPGAWSQYLRRKLSPGGAAAGELNGTIIALDVLPMEPVEGVIFIQGDFREPEVLAQLEQAMSGRKADVVVSDMAPNLSGIESADAARIAHLVELAVEFAVNHMKPEGALVTKVFHGSGYSQLVKQFKETFRTVKPLKPKASRDKSSETFLVGLGLKAVK